MFGLLLATAVCLPFDATAALATGDDPLAFPADRFTEESKTVKVAGQDREVRYRVFRHIPYVAKPVDIAYQSLDVSVPVAIDGKPVDASQAPIVLNITVGGYLSVNNKDGVRRGPPPGMLPTEGVAGPQPGNAGPGFAEEPRPDTVPGAAARSRPPMMGGNGAKVELALASGYVVVTPGVRGWDNKADDGSYFGKAPAAIVDLKAVVRYIRHNARVLPGNPDWIVSSGCSAGGALSALVGASGNSPLYDRYLKEIGAADAPDDIFAGACYSPITDLEHADMSYEWMFGPLPGRSGVVDQEMSAELASANLLYQDSLGLQGRDAFGPVDGERLADYVLQAYAQPAASRYLSALSAAERAQYLSRNPWIRWDGFKAQFAFADYAAHIGRMKGLPAFDDFKLLSPETRLFGDRSTDARHFTAFSQRHVSGGADTDIPAEMKRLVDMMNAMYFVRTSNPSIAPHWWLRNGSSDNNNAQSVMINLATALENRGRKVNAALFWDGGHCADDDPQGMVAWIADITGYSVTAR